MPPHLVGSAPARRGQGQLQLLEHGLRELLPHLHVLHTYIHSHHAKSSLLGNNNFKHTYSMCSVSMHTWFEAGMFQKLKKIKYHTQY